MAIQPGIIRGQKVERAMLERAKELRRQMTEAERMLWQHLRRNRLAGLHFRRQQVVHGYIVDFYCHSCGLVVEVDGEVHTAQGDQDAARDALLAAHGLRVVRVTNEQILHELPTVLELLERTACDLIPARFPAGDGGYSEPGQRQTPEDPDVLP